MAEKEPNCLSLLFLRLANTFFHSVWPSSSCRHPWRQGNHCPTARAPTQGILGNVDPWFSHSSPIFTSFGMPTRQPAQSTKQDDGPISKANQSYVISPFSIGGNVIVILTPSATAMCNRKRHQSLWVAFKSSIVLGRCGGKDGPEIIECKGGPLPLRRFKVTRVLLKRGHQDHIKQRMPKQQL